MRPKTIDHLLGPSTKEFNSRQRQQRDATEPDEDELRRIHKEFQDKIVELVRAYRAGDHKIADLGIKLVDAYANWVELYDPAFNDSPASFAAAYTLGMVPRLKAHFGELSPDHQR
ncbi:hypothetical protein HY497_01965 [Candidatus Woesearchaeota archaeon]|nr:hypothetical protein [Candidatus Woesearchaeota archaeon]